MWRSPNVRSLEKGLISFQKSQGKFWYVTGIGNIVKFKCGVIVFWNWGEKTVWRSKSKAEVTLAIILTVSHTIVNWIYCVSNVSAVFKVIIEWNNDYNEPGIVFLHNRFWINISLLPFFVWCFCQLRSGRYNRPSVRGTFSTEGKGVMLTIWTYTFVFYHIINRKG